MDACLSEVVRRLGSDVDAQRDQRLLADPAGLAQRPAVPAEGADLPVPADAGTHDHNPFLHLAGNPSQSYALTRRGVQLGAGSEGFKLLHLQRDAGHGDWAPAQACIRLDARPPACGALLVDTGITGMFMTLPDEGLPFDLADPTHLRDGTSVAIERVPGDKAHAAMGYAFKVGGQGEAAAPSSVILAGIGRRANFVNTGVHILNRFDYLYDAKAGVVGFRAAGLR